MFRSTHIITATQFMKDFRRISQSVLLHEEPYLIVKKNGEKLVLIDPRTFEDLIGIAASLNRNHVVELPKTD